MEMLTPASTCRHARIRFTTQQPTEFIDLTEHLERLIGDGGVRFGILNVQTLHESAAPCDAGYQHDDTTARTVNLTAAERPNGHAHCRALLLPSSVSLNVSNGRVLLGKWQRVFLVELDGPREREISVLLVGEAGQ